MLLRKKLAQFVYVVVLVILLPHAHLSYSRVRYDYDLTIAGYMIFGDGIGKVAVLLANCLKNHARINWVPTSDRPSVYPDVPQDIRELAEKNKNNSPGRVAILTDLVWHPGSTPANNVPQKSLIKIAYSMVEATSIPVQWVQLLNEKFDLVVVPDPFLIGVYQNAGVRIPIFHVPLPMYLDEFLAKPLKTKKGKPFIFGNLSGTWDRKNHVLLLKAFEKAFGNSTDVKLIMNSRGGEPSEIHAAIKNSKANNIEFREKNLSWPEYVEFLESIDCYVSFSKGEGFALAPREALALGIPVILSNNTAHTTICSTGFVKCVDSTIREPAYYQIFGQTLGNFFNSTLEDARAALVDVYTNYETYLQKAFLGKKWVSAYKPEYLTDTFLNLVKPAQVLYGDMNVVNDTYIMTNSRTLYEKYLLVKQAIRK